MYFSIREQARQIQTNHANQRRVNYKDIAGQCRTNLWPAVTEWPWCRNTDTGLTQMNTSENADAGLTFFRHSGISAFAYIRLKRYVSATSRVRTWGCIPYTMHQQVVNVRVYPFPPPAGCEREGVSLPPTAGCERGGVSLSINSWVWTWGCIPSTTSRLWTWGCIPSTISRVWAWWCIPFHHQQGVNVRVCLFPLSTVLTRGCIISVDVRVYPFPPPAVFFWKGAEVF
jgi:hypothetical protein